jgi:hypothetical protein
MPELVENVRGRKLAARRYGTTKLTLRASRLPNVP